jgi:hypothetical protein
MLRSARVGALVAAVLSASSAQAAGPSCFDRRQNGPESDIDCGGDCPACEYGRRCLRARDCISGLCAEGLCIERAHARDDPVPPGYQVEVSEHDAAAGVRTTGLWFFGVSYAGAYVTALSVPGKLSFMYLPVLGPWLALGNAEDDALRLLIIADGAFQAAGAALLVGGIVGRGYQLVRTESARVELLPKLGRDQAGLLLEAAF